MGACEAVYIDGAKHVPLNYTTAPPDPPSGQAVFLGAISAHLVGARAGGMSDLVVSPGTRHSDGQVASVSSALAAACGV